MAQTRKHRRKQEKSIKESLKGSFEPKKVKRKLLAIEKATLCYATLTTLLCLILWPKLNQPFWVLMQRVLIVAGMALLYIVHLRRPCEFTRFLRNLFPLTLIAFWYPDIWNFCQVFPNLDHFFAEVEEIVFGAQPSLLFSKELSGTFWSEVFNLGYFSYFIMIVVTLILPLFQSRRLFEKTAFIVLSSFFLYYVIFLFLPVAGPQFYFHTISAHDIQQGIYPALGDYFRTHSELAASGSTGIFHDLVDWMHAAGERPMAAFPSSHVGAGTVMMILLARHSKVAALIFAPFFVLLCLSTVYIQAHYLIDVFAGLLTGVLFYIFTHWLYSEWHKKEYSHKKKPTAMPEF